METKTYHYTAVHTHEYGETTYILKSTIEHDPCSEDFLKLIIEKTGMDYEEDAGETLTVALIDYNNTISLD